MLNKLFRIKLTAVSALLLTLSAGYGSFASATGSKNKGDGYDELRRKSTCNAVKKEMKVQMFAEAWTKGIDDLEMLKCFFTLTSREQADTWDTFVKLGGGKDIFDKNKEKILSQPKAKSLKEILEFTEGSKPTSEIGATKFTAKPVDVKQKSFGPSIITVQTLGWSSQSNWVADNYWQNNLCDGDGADLDWEYAYYFGEPTYAYQFRVWGSSGPVAALLYWYQYNGGGVIGRAPGNGDVILCIGNGEGNLPDWYVAYSMNMWR